jgi:hypothetical protein
VSLSRLVLGLLAVALSASFLPSSGATFTASSTAAGRVTAAADWTPPTVTVRDPGSPLRGTVVVTADAADDASGVGEVRIEVAPTGTGTWSPLCTDATAPYSCSWSTAGGSDGRYDLRAVATDRAGNTTTSPIVLARTVDNRGPEVAIDEDALPEALRGTVTITALATDAGTGVASVRIQRSLADANSWSDLCTTTAAPYRCTWATSGAGDHDLRAIATDAVGNVTTSAIATVTVDNVAPSVTMVLPTATTLGGTVTLTANASDADTAVASVRIEYRATSTSPWVVVCTDTTAPYSCRWDTTQVPDGTTYQFRATATDIAGNTAVHAPTQTRAVDNRLASVSLEDPGAFLRGTVDLIASANAPGGVASVAIQYRVAGTTTWVTICTDTTAPYGCAWATTTVGDGRYDLRAVLTPVTGSVLASEIVSGRTVDNVVLRGTDVQAINGGTLGRIDTGDRVVLTYSERLDTTSVLAGWDGTTRAITVRARDGLVVGGTSTDDVLDVLAGSAAVHLGSVRLGGNYVEKSRTVTFQGTMTEQLVEVDGRTVSTVVIDVGAMVNTNTKDLRTVKVATTMTWTPSNLARDLTGSASSAAPVTETGPQDRDF